MSLAALLQTQSDEDDRVGGDPSSMQPTGVQPQHPGVPHTGQHTDSSQAAHAPSPGQAAQLLTTGDQLAGAQQQLTNVGGIEPLLDTTEGQPTTAPCPQVVGSGVLTEGQFTDVGHLSRAVGAAAPPGYLPPSKKEKHSLLANKALQKNTTRKVHTVRDKLKGIANKWMREDPAELLWTAPEQRVSLLLHRKRQSPSVSTFDPVVDHYLKSRWERPDFDQLIESLQKERDKLATPETLYDHVDRFVRHEAYRPQAQRAAFAAGLQQPTCRLRQGEDAQVQQPSAVIQPTATVAPSVSSGIASTRTVHQVQLGDISGMAIVRELLSINREHLVRVVRNLLGTAGVRGVVDAKRILESGSQKQAWGYLQGWSHRAVLYYDWNFASKPELALSIVAQLCYLSHNAGKGQDWGLLSYDGGDMDKRVSWRLYNALALVRQSSTRGQMAYSVFDALCGGGNVDWSGAMWQATAHIIEAATKQRTEKTQWVTLPLFSKQLQLPVDLAHILPWNTHRVVNAAAATLHVCLQLTGEILATSHMDDAGYGQCERRAVQPDGKQAAVWNIADTFVVALLAVLIGNGACSDEVSALMSTVYQAPCLAMSQAAQLSSAVSYRDASSLTAYYNHSSTGLEEAVQQACDTYPRDGNVGMRLGWYDAAVRNVIAGFGYTGWRPSNRPVAYCMDRSDIAEQQLSIVDPLIQWTTQYKASEVEDIG